MKSNSFMRNRKAFTTVLLFCTGFIASHPLVVSAADKVMAVQLIHQQQTIKGIVVDASGEPVIGANVVVLQWEQLLTLKVLFLFQYLKMEK